MSNSQMSIVVKWYRKATVNKLIENVKVNIFHSRFYLNKSINVFDIEYT